MSNVVLRTSDSEVCRIRCGPALQAFAMRWNYIVRQRHRWAEDAAARQRQIQRLQRDLRQLGVTTKQLRKLDGVVEVGVPDSRTDQWWEAKVLPWEYVLAAATKPYRADRTLLVVRHLKTGRRKRKRIPKTFALIETAPGKLSRYFDYSAERALVVGSLRHLDSATKGVLENPTAGQLSRELSATSPDVIHLTGVDNRGGRQLLGLEMSGVRDGLFLADLSGEANEVRAEEIATLLNSGSPNPLFVGFNCWDSGARMAPMTIQAGARSAIGFQHTFDETVAEIFFLNFYRACVHSRWNTLEAFCRAWEAVTPYRSRILGSSIVLWSADSLVSNVSAKDTRAWLDARFDFQLQTLRGQTGTRAADPDRDRIAELLQVSVRPKPQLNYSSLHNGESLFDQLTLRLDPTKLAGSGGRSRVDPRSAGDCDAIDRIDDLELEVQLCVGAEAYPFRSRLSLSSDRYRYDLEKSVKLPLTSELFRTLHERIQTNLWVDVRWHDQVLYRQTHSVWLAPIDQWTLEDRQIGWLPSFVQPRDPAVAGTIDVAQGYLQCLADRIGVGFDGYQSYNGFARGIDRWAGVDRQVRSIWSALLLGRPLRYINPPPSYAEFTQRLRTPSDTIEGGFGTCVDLAILMASCLEWVEIHPVLFLLHGHVFAGYWKDLVAYQRFLDVVTDDLPVPSDAPVPSDETAMPANDEPQRWVCGRKTYPEIRGLIDRGELVPLETVALTTGGGFEAAIDAGREHFYKSRNRGFRAMIDLVSAREGSKVTPLPIFFAGQPGVTTGRRRS